MNNKIRDRKKSLMVFWGILIISGFVKLSADTVMFSASGGYLFPADSGYREIYGQNLLVPEFKLGVRVFSDIYVYGNFFSFSQNGLTPELQEPAHSRQQFFGGGLAYFPYLNKNKNWKAFIGAGVVNVSYKEEAMETIVSGKKLGFSIEGGLYFKEKFLFTGINVAYCLAKDGYEGVDFKMGGLRASLGLGFIF
jgi:hypothetical protein